MNPMNNMGNMGMMNNQNNMMNQMNNMGNMGMMNNQFNQINMMNPMNSNIMNSPMYQMCNQMNLVGNQMIQMGNESENYTKYLSIRVKMEEGAQILVQSTSKNKMEEAINNLCTKAVIHKEDYDFFVITEKNAKFDSTVEENGIIGNDDYILVKKKIKESKKSKKSENLNEINQNIENIKKKIK